MLKKRSPYKIDQGEVAFCLPNPFEKYTLLSTEKLSNKKKTNSSMLAMAQTSIPADTKANASSDTSLLDVFTPSPNPLHGDLSLPVVALDCLPEVECKDDQNKLVIFISYWIRNIFYKMKTELK
jgi:hypothetical protein